MSDFLKEWGDAMGYTDDDDSALWVARDDDGDKETAIYEQRPRWIDVARVWVRVSGSCIYLRGDACPDMAPGECRRVTLTLSPAPAPDTRTREGE